MSDKNKPYQMPSAWALSERDAVGQSRGGAGGKAAGGKSGAKASAMRLVNPTVRHYMDSLSLQKFYGGYQVAPLDEQIFNLGIGEVGNIDFPEDIYALYTRYLQAEANTVSGLASRYTGTMGDRETNKLVARAMNHWLGEDRFNENVVVSMDGGQNAVEVAFRIFTSPLGSTASKKQYVLMAIPAYPYFSAVVSAQAGIQAFLAYDGEAFARGVETYCNPSVGAILVNVPHNPAGYTLTAEQARRVNRMARLHDCAIVVDCVYQNFNDDPEVGRAVAEFDPERTVYVDSFSKKFALPGMRIGFALSAAPELTYAMRFIKTSESLTPGKVALAFAGHLLKHHADYPERIGTEVRFRRQRFENAFPLGNLAGVAHLGEEGNPFYQVLDVGGLAKSAGLSDTEMVKFCQEQFMVRMYPGGFVYPAPNLEHGVFSGMGRHNPHGPAPYLPPQYDAGTQIIYAPEAVEARVPLLRLSFGAETRVEAAAEALGQALGSLWGRAEG